MTTAVATNPCPPASGALPDETEGQNTVHSSTLFVQKDFAQLERIVQQNRTEKGRLIGTVWKTNAFFAVMSHPVHTGNLKASDYQPTLPQRRSG